MSKEILHIVNRFDVGGMENGLVNLINFSDPDQFSHSVCALRGIGRAGELVRQRASRLLFLGDDVGSPKRTIFLNLRDIIHEIRPDIVHIRHWGPLWDTVLAHFLTRCTARLVFSFHGKTYQEYCHRSIVTSFKRKLLLKCVDVVVTLNQDMVNTLREEEGVRGHITVLPNGVDIDKFCPSTQKIQLRRQLGLTGNEKILGTVGRLSKIKDVQTIIKSCALLKKKRNDFTLLVVGDGAERQNLQELIKKYQLDDVVHCLGTRKNVYNYMQCFDIYVQASLYEGFSNTIVEALSCGLPAIVTKVGGNEELVKHGENGFLINPGEHIVLAEYMNALLEDREIVKKFGWQSRKKVVENWSISKMINRYEKFYTRLMMVSKCP